MHEHSTHTNCDCHNEVLRRLLLNGVRVLEAVSCRDEPAAGDQCGSTHVAVAIHLEAHLPRPRSCPSIRAAHYLSPLPGSGATAWDEQTEEETHITTLKLSSEIQMTRLRGSETLPQRSSSELSKQSLTPSHSGFILLRHFPLAHLYEDAGQPLRSKQNERPEPDREEGMEMVWLVFWKYSVLTRESQ